VVRLGWHEPSYNAALKVAVDVGLCESLGSPDENKAFTLNELSDSANVAGDVFQRVLRHLAATGAIREVEQDGVVSYAATNPVCEGKISVRASTPGSTFPGRCFCDYQTS
jgi:hypothetical protein